MKKAAAPSTQATKKSTPASSASSSTAPKPKPPVKAVPTVNASMTATGGSGSMEDTYRTPTDDINSKKADVKSVRNELEDFEARLERGEGPKRAPSRISPPIPNKTVALTRKDSNPKSLPSSHAPSSLGNAIPHGTAGGGSNAVAALRKATPTKLVTTEEEDEQAQKRNTDINDVRNLPGDDEDDED